MEENALRGIPWTLLAYAANRAITLATVFVLARLLTPGDFGIVAFGLLIASFLTSFSTLGLAPTVVIRQDLDRVALGTAFSMLVGLYAFAAVLMAAFSPLAADLLGQPGSAGVIAALSVPVAVGGMAQFYWEILQRELQFPRRFASQAVQIVTMSVVSVTLAALGAGVWSLVAGQIAGTLALTVALFAVSPYRVRPTLRRSSARSLWRTSRGFLLQGGVTFVEQNTDYLVVGSVLGAQTLGVYSMGYRLAELPYEGVVEPIAEATFPGFARMRYRGEDVTRPFLTSLRLVSCCALPLGLLLAGGAAPFVHAVLGPKWTALIGLLPILGLWGSVRTLQGTIGWFVNAVGLAARVGASYLVMLAFSVPLLILGASEFGVEAVAWVMVGNVFVMLGIVAFIARRYTGVPLLDQWMAVRPSVLASAPAWLAAKGVADLTAGAPPAIALVASLAAGLTVYVAVVWWADPALPREGFRQVIRVLKRQRRVPEAPVPASQRPPV